MNSLTGFITPVIGPLGDARYPYVVTGSFASIFRSEPRTTMDFDVVLQADRTDLERSLTTEMAVSAMLRSGDDRRSCDLPPNASVSPETGSVMRIRGVDRCFRYWDRWRMKELS